MIVLKSYINLICQKGLQELALLQCLNTFTGKRYCMLTLFKMVDKKKTCKKNQWLGTEIA